MTRPKLKLPVYKPEPDKLDEIIKLLRELIKRTEK